MDHSQDEASGGAPSFIGSPGAPRAAGIGQPDAGDRTDKPSHFNPASFLQAVVDSISDGVIVADATGRFVLFNPAAERILGIGAAEMPQSEWSGTYGCFRSDQVTPYPSEELPLAHALLGENVYDCEVFIRNPSVPDGVWISIDGSPLRDDAGVVRGGVVVFRDVTAERQHSARVQLLSAVVEQTADSVIITDRQGVIEYVNPAATTITGYSEGELVGRTPRVFRSGVHGPDFYANLWRHVLEGRVYRGTIVNCRKNGEIFYSEQTITPVRDASGAFARFVSVAKDVTQLRKAAERDSKLLIARSVQQRLYPAAPPAALGLDIGGNSFMAEETGGDYFDFVPLQDDALLLLVGDVSGHGFDAALVMAETRAYLRSIAQMKSDPGKILRSINRVLVGDIAENQFVTMLLACVDVRSRSLTYASAGHPSGYVLEPDGTVRNELVSTGPPLGIFQDAYFATQTMPVLRDGDVLALFSDGVSEPEASNGTPFGTARALEVVHAFRHEPSAKIVNRLYRAIRDYAPAQPLLDDITAVICKVGPTLT